MSRPQLSLIALLALIAVESPAGAQCTSTLDGSSAFVAAAARESRPPEQSDEAEHLLSTQLAQLNLAAGLHATLQMVPGGGACVNEGRSTIYLGRVLVERLQAKLAGGDRVKADPLLANFAGAGRAAMRFALAHEFGHLLQHRALAERAVRRPDTLAIAELQADYLAGLWMGSDLASSNADVLPILAAIEVAATLGDEQWNNPQHHGAPLSRRSCAGMGMRVGQGQNFGPPSTAFTSRLADTYSWSLGFAADMFRRDRNQRTF